MLPPFLAQDLRDYIRLRGCPDFHGSPDQEPPASLASLGVGLKHQHHHRELRQIGVSFEDSLVWRNPRRQLAKDGKTL